MIKINSKPYPNSQFDLPAKLAHEDIPLESLVEWFEAPKGLHFTHVEVDDALSELGVEHSWPTSDIDLLNAIEIHMGRKHTYMGYDAKAVHIATIFFVNGDEFRILTPLRSDEALERVMMLAGHYIASLSRWMRDPVEADEINFLKTTEGLINHTGPVDHIRQTMIGSLAR